MHYTFQLFDFLMHVFGEHVFLYWILEMFFKLDWSSDFYISGVYNWRLQFNGSEVVWDTGILTKTFLDKYDNQLYLSSQLHINNESTEDLYKNNLVIINSFLLCNKGENCSKEKHCNLS